MGIFLSQFIFRGKPLINSYKDKIFARFFDKEVSVRCSAVVCLSPFICGGDNIVFDEDDISFSQVVQRALIAMLQSDPSTYTFWCFILVK